MPPQPYQKLVIKAYAKVNLALEVLGRRPDGYHEVRSLMQAIDLCDTLTFEPAHGLRLECSAQELATDDNLVLRAGRLLHDRFRPRSGARITLVKRIPWAARRAMFGV